MANSQVESITPTGWEIVPYSSPCNNQFQVHKASELRGSSPHVDATPLAIHVPDEVSHTVEVEVEADQGNETTKKRRKGIPTEVVEEVERDLTLHEIYKSENIQEIIQERERGLTTKINEQLLLESLKGWKVEKRRRHAKEDGKRRTDKYYTHLATATKLRSRSLVKIFIDGMCMM